MESGPGGYFGGDGGWMEAERKGMNG